MTQAETQIRHIGSRWAGQANGSIEDLLKLIAIEPLEEKYSPYCCLELDGSVRIHGQFERISHGFDLTTKDNELIMKFARAFQNNEGIDKEELYKADVPKSTIILMGLILEDAQ